MQKKILYLMADSYFANHTEHKDECVNLMYTAMFYDIPNTKKFSSGLVEKLYNERKVQKNFI